MTFSDLQTFAKNELNVSLSDSQIFLFKQYLSLIQKWNEIMNITTIIEENPAIVKHFIDSLYALKFVDMNNKSICDVGSGLGLPGVAVAIACPTSTIDLVESSKKKCRFLKAVKDELKLDNLNIINLRSEEIKTREKYDLVLARGLKEMNILIELTAFLAKVGGKIVAYKGPSFKEELARSQKGISKLKLKLNATFEYSLPEFDLPRSLVVFEKNDITNIKYPRSYSLIVQKPL